MNKGKLKREGEKWVAEQIITEGQLEKILAKYENQNLNVLMIIFAVLLTSLSFLTFIFSEWAQQLQFLKVILMLVIMGSLYVLGERFYLKRSEVLGISFIALGYVLFGAAMLLVVDMYEINLWSVWPFIVWTFVGLVLHYLYQHTFLFVISLIVATTGQFVSVNIYSDFNWILFTLFVLGFAHFTYHQGKVLFASLLVVSYFIQIVGLLQTNDLMYYWLFLFFIIPYCLSYLVPQIELQRTFYFFSVLGVFLLALIQSINLQDNHFISHLSIQTMYYPAILIAMLIAIILIVFRKKFTRIIDLILFIPIFSIAGANIMAFILLFIFALGWIIIGYQKEDYIQIQTGTVYFLLATLTVYVQFAWDELNKSLFFLIGGIILFIISFMIERQRKILSSKHKGGK